MQESEPRLRGHTFGLRFAVDFWGEPSETTMVAGDLSLSTVSTSYAARAALDWRVLDRFYSGPETQFYGSDGHRQWRLRLHITSMKTGEDLKTMVLFPSPVQILD